MKNYSIILLLYLLTKSICRNLDETKTIPLTPC